MMAHEQKREALVRLGQRVEHIEAANGRDVWLWPSESGVKGWHGAASIMAITFAPGYGHFPSAGDRVLYEGLGATGLTDLHLTSLFKTKTPLHARGDLPLDWKLTERNIEYLIDEVKIVSPRLIVPFGRDTTRVLDPFLGDLDVDPTVVRPLPSPFRAADDPQTLAEFNQQLRSVADEWRCAGSEATAGRGDQVNEDLNEVRQRVVDCLLYDRGRQVYFWTRRYGVAGWSGTDPIFIVGSYPSDSYFPTDADIFFYGELRANRLHNGHLTDVLKASASPKNLKALLADADVMLESRFCLMREIEIIRPRLFVVMGDKARRLIEDWLPDLRRDPTNLDPDTIVYISHYTRGFYDGNSSFRAQFQQELKAVAERFRAL